MNLKDLFADKQLKPSEKIKVLCRYVCENPTIIDELVTFAENSKHAIKASCIEAIEFATQTQPEIANQNCFHFIERSLVEKEPRVKWESAKVIANIAHLYTSQLKECVHQLINNTSNEGTVVRWSAATALAKIMLLNSVNNIEIIPIAKDICEREEKNSIKYIYMAAFKKLKI